MLQFTNTKDNTLRNRLTAIKTVQLNASARRAQLVIMIANDEGEVLVQPDALEEILGEEYNKLLVATTNKLDVLLYKEKEKILKGLVGKEEIESGGIQ